MISLDVSLQNETKGDNFISDIQSKLNDSKWYWFFLSIFLAQIWVIFLTFYNSRVIGLIMTAVINKFVKLGHIKLGKKIYNTYSWSDHWLWLGNTFGLACDSTLSSPLFCITEKAGQLPLINPLPFPANSPTLWEMTVKCLVEKVSDCFLTPNEQFSAISLQERVTFSEMVY